MTTIEHTVRNGVDTTTLFATLDAVKEAPQAAQFQFRARNEWVSGTHSRTTIDEFFGVGETRSHNDRTVVEVDHPEVLVGADHAPTPVEYVLHALAGCLTAGIANIAAARGVELTAVSSTVEGDAPADTLRAIVEQSRRRSAVFDILTNGVPVSIEVDAA